MKLKRFDNIEQGRANVFLIHQKNRSNALQERLIFSQKLVQFECFCKCFALVICRLSDIKKKTLVKIMEWENYKRTHYQKQVRRFSEKIGIIQTSPESLSQS